MTQTRDAQGSGNSRLWVTITHRADCVVVHPIGRVDANTVGDLEDAVSQVCAGEYPRVVIDLSTARPADTSLLSLLKSVDDARTHNVELGFSGRPSPGYVGALPWERRPGLAQHPGPERASSQVVMEPLEDQLGAHHPVAG